jgi:hypothetical protein
MEDKEKQIAEMAKIIKDNSIIDVTYGGKPYADDYENLARKLLEHYQPKIPKDSVVLSREEYEILKVKEKEKHWLETCMSVWKNGKIDGGKETAEKIIKFVSEHCDNETLIWQLDEFVANNLLR